MYSEHSGHTLLTQDILLNLLQQSDTLTPTQVAMRRSQGTGGATGSKMLHEDDFKIMITAVITATSNYLCEHAPVSA